MERWSRSARRDRTVLWKTVGVRGLRETGLTRLARSHIVSGMPCGRFSIGHRLAAVVALAAFLAMLSFASSGAIAAADEPVEELCTSCGGCDAGECGGEDGSHPDSHHHCCATSCLSHAALTLPSAPSTTSPAEAEPLPAPVARSLSPRSPEPPYRPPRV